MTMVQLSSDRHPGEAAAALQLCNDALMPNEPQNIYDDPGFFAGYSTLERFGAGWERAAEHNDLLALLPDLSDRRVLDLGCGAGQLARHLADAWRRRSGRRRPIRTDARARPHAMGPIRA